MDHTLENLIRSAAMQLEAAEPSEAQDFCGFRQRAAEMTDLFIESLFPRHAAAPIHREDALRQAAELLDTCLRVVLPPSARPESVVRNMLESLPEIRRQLGTDLEAAYRGDPAARSILCYPAFLAISTYRLAHVLYRERIPTLPRVMTEYAHRLTGIDIHPGAQIGDSFFIDHGTGVVIGETTTIGENVKLYQHVTLGAKSFDVGEDGTLVKGIKRHPDIGDRVVIYSGATILGGNTHIGNDCVIGGSVWLTHSVEAGKMVLARTAVTDSSLTRDITAVSSLESAML